MPVDPETDCIEDSFMGWMPGTHREEIWHWFDQRCSKGVAYLLYGDGIDRTDQIAKAVYLKQLCIECKSQTCRFNHGGECALRWCMNGAPASPMMTTASIMLIRLSKEDAEKAACKKTWGGLST